MENVNNSLLHFWQKQQFQNGSNLSRQLDSMRTVMGHIAFASHIKNISEIEASTCATKIFQDYTALLDSPEGLNNYADSALKLAQSCRNDAKQWKSSLSKNVILETIKDLGINEELIASKNSEINVDFCKSLRNSTAADFPLEHFTTDNEKFSATNASHDDSSNLRNTDDHLNPIEARTTLKTDDDKQNAISTKKAFCQYSNKSNQNDETSGYRNDRNNSNFSRENSFCTAKDQLITDMEQKNTESSLTKSLVYGSNNKKSLGTRRGLNSKFIPPIAGRNQDSENESSTSKNTVTRMNERANDSLKLIEPRMVELILSEIMDQGEPVSWDDIAGLEFAKNTIKEIIIWPMLRPDIFRGLRGPPKGILLFGPPGTGKTLIGKCIASQSKATFFSISASSLTSKWVGEGEKMVRALFTVARSYQPAVIFIDEIDSLLTHRSDSEHESSRRIKTEFLVQLDGASTSTEERLLVVGATNRPQELDEAARRRLVKRLYIPLPNALARHNIISNLLKEQHNLTQNELQDICNKTEGYSGADMKQLCQEAALGPIRSISFADIQKISANDVRPISYDDFLQAVNKVKASVSQDELTGYEKWNEKYGCHY